MAIIGVGCAGSDEKDWYPASGLDSQTSLCMARRVSKWQCQELADGRLSNVNEYSAGERKSYLKVARP